jgi:uncharacterized protein with HEPN domain
MREPRRDRLRLQHMLDACDALMEFVSGRKEEDLLTDKMLLAAVSRQIEILGEAANMLTVGLRERHPEVPWKQIISMRHMIIHEYFAVQTDTVWDVAQNDVPLLREQLSAIIDQLPEGGF